MAAWSLPTAGTAVISLAGHQVEMVGSLPAG
jgi:hypothetical protein